MPGAVSSPYRVGLIGCGAIGSDIADAMEGGSIRIGLPYGHAPTYLSMTRVALVAAAEVNPGRREAFAQRWSFPPQQIYAEYREMLAREQLDVVSIASPTPLHAEMALAALDSGARAIFLEKPIASNLVDAERVVAACARAGVPLVVNHTRRGDQVYRRARTLIADGAIGRLHSLTALLAQHLMLHGTHSFDMLNYFAGASAHWISGHLDEPAGFDPGGSGYILYENGVRAFVNGSTGGSIFFRIQAIGSEGELVIGNHELELYRRNPHSEAGELLRHPFPLTLPARSPMVTLVDELLDALEGGPPPLSNGQTATDALALIVALHASSAQDGKRISPRDVDRTMIIPSL